MKRFENDTLCCRKLYFVKIRLNEDCSAFLLVRATFTEEKLLWATCIFINTKLQIIASLLYKICAHFGQYIETMSPKVGEDQTKRSSPQIGADSGQYYGNLSPKVGEDLKKKVFAANPN